MLYRQRFNTFIRIYGDIGYIVNFDSFVDRVVNTTAALILSALSRSAREEQEIITDVAKHFTAVDMPVLEQDTRDFLNMLVEDNLIVSGNSEMELDSKDQRFSYNTADPKTIKEDFTPKITRARQKSAEFLGERRKENPQIFTLQLELTSRCNERCVHCYIPHENKTADIDMTRLFAVLDQFKAMGGIVLTISGGEPMMHPQFPELLRRLRGYDFIMQVFSNLTLLDDEILSLLKESHIFNVQVSLYSMNAAVHDSVTKLPGSFEKTMAALLTLKENNIPLHISSPAMKQNKDSYGEVLRWAFERRISASSDYVMFARYDHTLDNLDNRLPLDDVGNIIKEILAHDKPTQSYIKRKSAAARNKRPGGEEKICDIGQSSLTIGANGALYLCPTWRDRELGNIRDNSLEEIWFKSPEVLYFRNLRKKDMPECLACADSAYCSMCLNRNANENPDGNPLKVNKYFCRVAALEHKIVEDWLEKQAVCAS
ncbi:MAG: hypothetical protein Pg6C_04240 [Treponemataceae bacterium]|nr:MAG: hypothetical protein Pg6C_04240 [Treponemataceae bacterium]